jgi:hypothetical protein
VHLVWRVLCLSCNIMLTKFAKVTQKSWSIGIMVEFPIGYQQRGMCVYWVPTARYVCLLGTNSAVCVSIGYQQHGMCVYWVPTTRSVCLLGTNSAVCVSIEYQQRGLCVYWVPTARSVYLLCFAINTTQGTSEHFTPSRVIKQSYKT